MLDDKTLQFIFYMKYYRPRMHDNLTAMSYVGVNHARYTLKQIFRMCAEPCKFPWQINDINLFNLRQALLNGSWPSKSWDSIAKEHDNKVNLVELGLRSPTTGTAQLD